MEHQAHAFDLAGLRAITDPSHVLGRLRGPVKGVAGLEDAGPEDISFVNGPKYREALHSTRAGAVLVPMETAGDPPAGQAWLFCENPSLALARLCRVIESRQRGFRFPGVHPSAAVDLAAHVDATACIGPQVVVAAGAVIGRGCTIEAGVIVGENVRLGTDCHLYPRVVLYRGAQLGNRIVVHAGTVIGSDGFGYEAVNGKHEKIPQIGTVVIEDDVEIGANCTIDRARFGETRIGAGSKIDNLVQIAHNVTLGKGCILCAQAGISGSSHLGDYVILAGQAGVAGHLRLADHTVVGAQGGVAQDTEPGTYYRDTPAFEANAANRSHMLYRKLPEMNRRLRRLEATLGETAPKGD